MPSNCKNRIVIFFLCFSLVLVGYSQAQEKSMPKPEFGDGALEEVSAEMEKLLELKWNGDNLALRRDWNERLKQEKAGDKDEGDELNDEIKKLIERGIPEQHAEQLAKVKLRQGMMQKSRPGVEKAFMAIPTRGGSTSSGGSGDRRSLRFSSRELSGAAVVTNDNLRFEFTENNGDERNFKISDNGEGQIKFEFSFDNLFIRLVQSDTGKTQLIYIDNDQADVYVGDTFFEFMKLNPRVSEELLFPLLKRLGVKTPLGRKDPRILAAAIIRLERMNAPNNKNVAELIKDLDSDSYQVRQAASKDLNKGYEQWSVTIKKHAEDTKLSLEARVRLKEIVDEKGENEIANLINGMRLLDSPDFLVSVLESANDTQKASVVKQLEKVTDQTHGTDLQAWKKWLQENK